MCSGAAAAMVQWRKSLTDHSSVKFVAGAKPYSHKCTLCTREDCDQKRLRESLCVGFPLAVADYSLVMLRIRYARSKLEPAYRAIEALRCTVPEELINRCSQGHNSLGEVYYERLDQVLRPKKKN